MPWWNRTIVPPRRGTATFGGPAQVLLSDPALIGDAQSADEVRGFLDVQWTEAGTAMRIYRQAGPEEGSLVALDPIVNAEVSAPGITVIEWPSPLPPCIQTEPRIVRTTAGTGSAEVSVLQTARWD